MIKAERKTGLANKILRKELQYEYKQPNKQNKQLEEFAYIVSHNFRAPVSNLLSYSIYKRKKISKLKSY
jgi:light-regulated signal transduction histidine kinase (bacteriophytochrome)